MKSALTICLLFTLAFTYTLQAQPKAEHPNVIAVYEGSKAENYKGACLYFRYEGNLDTLFSAIENGHSSSQNKPPMKVSWKMKDHTMVRWNNISNPLWVYGSYDVTFQINSLSEENHEIQVTLRYTLIKNNPGFAPDTYRNLKSRFLNFYQRVIDISLEQ